MTAKNAKAEIESLYVRASGSGTVRGAVSWAAERLGISRKTVQRWVAGETRPRAEQLERIRAAAAVDERARRIRAARLARRGPWRRLSRWLDSRFLDDVTESANRRADERAAAQTRANQTFQPPPQRSWLRSRSRY